MGYTLLAGLARGKSTITLVGVVKMPKSKVSAVRAICGAQQPTLLRLFEDPSYRHLRIEGCIPRAEAIDRILTGFSAACEQNWAEALYLEWAGYDLYKPAAPLGKEHLTRIQLRPAASGRRYEFVWLQPPLRATAHYAACAF